jgi:hypothetical protein
MGVEEALSIIEDSKRQLDPLKVFGQVVVDGIAQLDRLDTLIKERSFVEAYKMSSSFSDQISPYRNFIPHLAENLDRIREILRKAAM